MKATIISILVLILSSTIAHTQDRVYRKHEVLEDLLYLKHQLEENHPGIYLYTLPESFLSFFNSISVPDSISQRDVYSFITSTNKVILDGHTLFYPNRNLISKNQKSGLYLPFEIFWNGQKLYILYTYGESKELRPGHEIISINGKSSKELIHQLRNKMMSDGNNLTYPTWVLNNYFSEYYSYFYGCSDDYDLIIKENERIKKIQVPGIHKSALLNKNHKNKYTQGKGIHLEIDDENSIAKLTIKDWHNDILKKEYGQNFKSEIKSIINIIECNKIQNLIIDVRNNQGGDLKNSKYLLSYLLEEPFILIEDYKKVKKGSLVHTKGPQMGIHKPMKTSYSGNIYVLINGGSFSNTSIFCSVLEKYKRAIFIGEETGGSEFKICGNSKYLTLPNTGIEVNMPTLQYIIKTSSENELHGVIPDFEIKPTIDNLITGKDEALEYTHQLILKRNQPN